jgi:Cytosol aminopeptidase family, N-terminal domain
MQILFRDLSLRSLDALSADSLVLFIDQQERPLQGLAGLCDWRLCGQLSRVIQTGFFEGKGGEALLMPIGHRLAIVRLLAFGVGDNGAGTESLAARAFEAVSRAGGRSVVLSIDALGSTLEQAAAIWLRASRASRFERQLLLSGDRGLARVVRAVAGADPGLQFEGESVGTQPGQKLG